MGWVEWENNLLTKTLLQTLFSVSVCKTLQNRSGDPVLVFVLHINTKAEGFMNMWLAGFRYLAGVKGNHLTWSQGNQPFLLPYNSFTFFSVYLLKFERKPSKKDIFNIRLRYRSKSLFKPLLFFSSHWFKLL